MGFRLRKKQAKESKSPNHQNIEIHDSFLLLFNKKNAEN